MNAIYSIRSLLCAILLYSHSDCNAQNCKDVTFDRLTCKIAAEPKVKWVWCTCTLWFLAASCALSFAVSRASCSKCLKKFSCILACYLQEFHEIYLEHRNDLIKCDTWTKFIIINEEVLDVIKKFPKGYGLPPTKSLHVKSKSESMFYKILLVFFKFQRTSCPLFRVHIWQYLNNLKTIPTSFSKYYLKQFLLQSTLSEVNNFFQWKFWPNCRHNIDHDILIFANKVWQNKTKKSIINKMYT